MSKTEILEKYFLVEIEEENKEVDMTGWWIVGKVKEAVGNHMEVLGIFETDPEAWLENFKFILLENGYVLSDHDCFAYQEDILEAMTEIYPDVNLNKVINDKIRETLNSRDTWTIHPDYYTSTTSNPDWNWWNGSKITCTNGTYTIDGTSTATSIANDIVCSSETDTATTLDTAYSSAVSEICNYYSSVSASC